MRKKRKNENSVHLILSIGSRKIINIGIKKCKVFLLKSCLLLIIIAFLLLLTNNYFSVYKEKKVLKNNILQITNEIEYIKKKSKDLGKYKKKINNLLGYEIYKNYVDNNKK